MKRIIMICALLGTMVFGVASTSQAYYPYVRPMPRFAYGPRPWVGPRYNGYGYYRPRFYGPGFYRPGFYGYRAWGPGFYGGYGAPGFGFGVY